MYMCTHIEETRAKMKQTLMHMLSIFVICLFIFLNLPANAQSLTEQSQSGNLSTKHFVLVHGAGHGAWSWYKLAALIKSSGHNVTALDLAASGIDPHQAISLKSISEYFKPLTDFMEALHPHRRVILVGHSYGGLALSHSMERFPNKISVAVFVTALMPGPDLNYSTVNQESIRTVGSTVDSHYTYDDGPNNPPTTFVLGPLYLLTKLYQLSPFQDFVLASTLVRPLRLFNETDTSRELVLSRNNYGSVKRVFIVTEKDLTVVTEFQYWMIKGNPPNQVDEIKGSDHMVMMSKPLELWERLQSIANNWKLLNSF